MFYIEKDTPCYPTFEQQSMWVLLNHRRSLCRWYFDDFVKLDDSSLRRIVLPRPTDIDGQLITHFEVHYEDIGAV